MGERMNIIVFIKGVPKLSDVKINQDFTISRNSGAIELNPNDFFAVEEALRIKDKVGAKITAVCLGNIKCKKVLRYALSLGVDQAILVCDDAYRGSDTYATAYILSEVVKKIGVPSLILCGKKSSDGSTSQVPVEIAAMLGLSLCTNVVDCKTEQDYIVCKEEYEQEFLVKQITYPAVVTVTSDINVPRLPTVDGILQSKEKEIEVLSNLELKIPPQLCGLQGSLTTVIKTERMGPKSEKEKKVFQKKEDILRHFKLCLKNTVQSKNEDAKSVVKERNLQTNRNVLVFCEVYHGSVLRESLDVLERAAVLAGKMNAKLITVTTNVEDKDEMIEEFEARGVSENYLIEIENIYTMDTERLSQQVIEVIKKTNSKTILMASTRKGMTLAPYIAARLKSGLTADCIELDYMEEKLYQKRPAFGGKINAVIVAKNTEYEMATVKPFVEKHAYAFERSKLMNYIISCEATKKQEAGIQTKDVINIDNKIVIGMGKGMKSQKNVQRLLSLCKKKGYGVCATREIVDNGWISYEYQVGLTGKIIQPTLYIALGISGAMEHVVGVQTSDTIISVNNKEMQPIFEYSDYIYQMDTEEFIDLLEAEDM